MKTRFFLAIGIAFAGYQVAAQQTPLPVLPSQITGPMTYHSPEVASFGRYAMNAPDLSSGQIQHAIPLFTISDNGIDFPVSLNYSYSGFKPRERATSAGLGWSLTEGSIIRIVKGLPDEQAYKKFEEFNYDSPLPSQLVNVTVDPLSAARSYDIAANRVLNKKYDGQPDEYLYNFNGYSGRFIWVDNQAILYPYADLRISRYEVTGIGGGFYFKIATPEGLEYSFKAMDETYNQHHWDEEEEGYTDVYYGTNCGKLLKITLFTDNAFFTAWRLTNIKNINTKAEANFEYNSYTEERHFEGNDCSSITFYTDGQSDPNGYFTNMTEIVEPHPGYQTSKNFYITKISTNECTLNYYYKPRADYGFMPGVDSITFKGNLSGNIFKTAKFKYYSPGSYHMLKELLVSGMGNADLYKFTYNGSAISDDYSKAIDHWGYANGKQNITLVPRNSSITAAESSGAFNLVTNYNSGQWADRTPDFSEAVKGSLSEITYPTGGKSTITYESAGGRGIRVKSTTDYDPYSNAGVSKYYQYAPDVPVDTPVYNGNDYMDHVQVMHCQPSNFNYPVEWYTRRYLTFTANSSSTLDFFDQTVNFYDTVTEYVGSPTGSNGRNEYRFVREFATGKTYQTDLLQYNSLGNLVKKTENAYEKQELRTVHFWSKPSLFQPGVVVPCNTSLLYGGEPCDGSDEDFQFILAQTSNLSISQEQLKINWWKLKENVVTDYASDNSGFVTTNTSKNYYRSVSSPFTTPRSALPIKSEQFLSNGSVSSLETYFPGDNYSDGINSYVLGPVQMWNTGNANYKFLSAWPMKMIRSLNGTKQQELDYTYTYNSTDDEINLTKSELKVNNELIKTVDFSYAPHNLLVSTSDDGDKQSLIRDYGQRFITARINKAGSGEVAYTGFEGGYFSGSQYDINKGNWTFNTAMLGSLAASGIKSLLLPPVSGNIVSEFSLANGRQYVLTFWAKGEGCEVLNGTTLQPSVTPLKNLTGGWKLYSYKLSGNGLPVTIRTGATATGGIYFDDVRLMPVSAGMQTFTLDDAGKVTSVCDERNVYTFYFYDDKGRLQYVKDEQGNILKKHTYQLQGAE